MEKGDKMNRLIEDLINSFGVSSREEEIKNIIKREVEQIKEDNMGNLILKIGQGSEKIMISTHMDNSGVMATFIDDNGFIRISPIGDIKAEDLVGNLIKFQNGTLGRVYASKANPSKDDLFVDLGVSSRETAIKQVKEGDVAEVIVNKLESNCRIVSSNLHNKLCCYALLQVIKGMEDISLLDKEIYFVFTSEKESGFKGARAAAYEIKPDVSIVLDGVEAGDYIGGKGNIKLDKGCVISVFDRSLVIHHKVKELLENAAETLNINPQYSISDDKNEGGLIHKEVGGIKTGMIGIPCRYMHTSGEMMSLEDVNQIIDLLKVIINSKSI